METVRKEILPGVWLTALENDKFKTGCLSISLLTQLDRETAAMNALIPYVLRRGSRNHTDMQALATELDGLYGSYIEPVVRKIGEIQCIGFYGSFPARALHQGRPASARICRQREGEAARQHKKQAKRQAFVGAAKAY